MPEDRRDGADDFPSHWMKPAKVVRWKSALTHALPYFVLLAPAPAVARRRALAPWLLSPFVGLFAYRLTIVMHDCIHRTLFEDRALNDRVGTALGAITAIDFRRFAV